MIVARVHRVVIVIGDDPFERPFGGSAKFTTPGVAVTVNEDGKSALKLIGPAGELTCADVAELQTKPSKTKARVRHTAAPARFLRSNSPMLTNFNVVELEFDA